MPVFEYSALDVSGKNLSGVIDADSLIQARQKLRASGKYPVKIQETLSLPQGKSRPRFTLFTYLKRIRAEEIYALTRQLATLLNAGVPLVSGLDALIRQTENTALKKVVAQVKESVNEGNSLTDALSEHQRHFSAIYVNMVRAGEASGTLDVVLERLADFGENQIAIANRFRAALIYPIFMTLIGSLILFFLVTYVVPNITSIFVEMQRVLPLPTRILINVSAFCKTFWWVMLLIGLGAVIAARMAVRSDKGRRLWDTFRLRVPVFGPVNRKIALARIGRTLGSLLQNSVSLPVSMNIVKNVVNNVLIAEVIDEAADHIQEGKSMTTVFSRSEWFPPMFVQMVSVGEQSGELEKMLGKAADSYDREVEASIQGLTSILEPLMILIMGVIVGFIVISILLPIFDMNQMIR